MFCPRGRIGGQKQKQGGQKNFAPFGRDSAPPDLFLPPYKKFSAPAKINPAHATVNYTFFLFQFQEDGCP
jgi:hypothetical protein